MSNTIVLTEPQVNTLMGTYLGIQLEHGPTQTGPFSLAVQLPYVLNQTTYTYVDVAGLVTDWYRTARYTASGLGPYSNEWPVQSQEGPGYSLSQYRRRLADAAGFNIVTQASGLSPQTNQLVVADFQSTELEGSFLGNTWEYQPGGPNAGECRRVVYGGLQNGMGVVTVERAHSVLTPPGTVVEFHGKLPAIRREGRLGLNDIVNRVLAECWTVQRVSVPGVDQQRVYWLGNLMPWLRAPDQIVDVYYLGATTDPNAREQLMPSWQWRSGADNPGLELRAPITNGSWLIVELFVPMSWWVDSGLGFGLAQVEGLHAETDRAILPLEGMEMIGQAYINLELSKWGLTDDQTRYLALRAQARAAANEWKRLSLERPSGRKQHWPSVMTVPSFHNQGLGDSMMLGSVSGSSVGPGGPPGPGWSNGPRDPLPTDVQDALQGQMWLNTVSGDIFEKTSAPGAMSTWARRGGAN